MSTRFACKPCWHSCKMAPSPIDLKIWSLVNYIELLKNHSRPPRDFALLMIWGKSQNAEISIFNIGNFSQKIVLKCPLVMQNPYQMPFMAQLNFCNITAHLIYSFLGFLPFFAFIDFILMAIHKEWHYLLFLSFSKLFQMHFSASLHFCNIIGFLLTI